MYLNLMISSLRGCLKQHVDALYIVVSSSQKSSFRNISHFWDFKIAITTVS